MQAPANVAITGAWNLISADFSGIYQVHIAAANERLSMLRFALSLLATPFGATVALVSARVVEPSALTSWPRVPLYLFGLLTAFGVLAVLPYLRMIEASLAHARTARALNNFRLLYVTELRTEFIAIRWTPNLPVDPGFPVLSAPLSWPGMTAIAVAVMDGAYISVGLVGLSRVRPAPVLLIMVLMIVTLLLFAVYYIRINVSSRRDQPANPFGFPFVETL